MPSRLIMLGRNKAYPSLPDASNINQAWCIFENCQQRSRPTAQIGRLAKSQNRCMRHISQKWKPIPGYSPGWPRHQSPETGHSITKAATKYPNLGISPC